MNYLCYVYVIVIEIRVDCDSISQKRNNLKTIQYSKNYIIFIFFRIQLFAVV